jgi:uncharacterized protein YjbJ (UPF0337 family)
MQPSALSRQNPAGLSAQNSDFTREETAMTWVIVERTWVEARGRMKDRWSTLSEDDLDAIGGRRDDLVTRLRRNLNVSPEEADRQVTDWESRNRDLFEETAEQIKPYVGIAKQ